MKTLQFYPKTSTIINAGLRQYMLNVFSYMSGGLAVTALVAYIASISSAFMAFLLSSPLAYWTIALAPLGVAFYLITKISGISPEKARALFFGYAAMLGLSLSSIFFVYSAVSIANTFFVTSSMFLSMVIYGYVTQRDLTSFGSFLMMGLIGLIIAVVVNVFMKSPVADLVISAIGVIVFTGLTAYDTQVIKSYYIELDSDGVSEKKAIIGAFKLYLDFVNLFLCLLRFMGRAKD